MKILEAKQVEAKWRGSPLASTIVFFRDCNREKKLNQENSLSNRVQRLSFNQEETKKESFNQERRERKFLDEK